MQRPQLLIGYSRWTHTLPAPQRQGSEVAQFPSASSVCPGRAQGQLRFSDMRNEFHPLRSGDANRGCVFVSLRSQVDTAIPENLAHVLTGKLLIKVFQLMAERGTT